MSEVALISARKSSLTADAKKGSRTAKNVLSLTERPNKFLSTVQIGITLIGILTGLYSGDSIAYKFSDILEGWGLVESVAQPVAQVTIVIVVTYLTIVLGELVPKRIAMLKTEAVARAVSGVFSREHRQGRVRPDAGPLLDCYSIRVDSGQEHIALHQGLPRGGEGVEGD